VSAAGAETRRAERESGVESAVVRETRRAERESGVESAVVGEGLLPDSTLPPRGGLPRPPRLVKHLSRRPGKAAARFGKAAARFGKAAARFGQQVRENRRAEHSVAGLRGDL